MVWKPKTPMTAFQDFFFFLKEDSTENQTEVLRVTAEKD